MEVLSASQPLQSKILASVRAFVKTNFAAVRRIFFPMDAFSSFFAVLMLSAGVFITLRLGGFQFTHLMAALKTALRPAFGKKPGAEKAGVTPFQAMASALGGSVGTANIAGTAGALALGGPGAIFWMWVAALFGMAVKFSEIVLALRYREKRNGEWVGGPMLYIERGLGAMRRSPAARRLSGPLARSFALFALLASLIGTPLVQANTVAESALSTVAAFGGCTAAVKPAAAPLLAALVGIVVLGGAKRIGRISELLVPFMALAYILVSLVVLVHFRRNIGPALLSILRGAFGARQAAGGICAYSLVAALRVGTARGVYSNEAGVGSSPMAHACAETDDPVGQGLFGIFEVFADTLVMCTLTALCVLSSGVPLSGSGAGIALSAFSSVLGGRAAGVFLAVSLLLFAYTSIIGWSAYGLQAVVYLFGKGAKLPFCLLFTALTALGVFLRSEAVWKAGETLNYLMAAPNMLAVLLLSGEVKKETRLSG